MNVDWPKPGPYVVAVSGGVDSIALLHLLQARPGLKLTVAHFDHGIRSDSTEDLELVRETAKKYKLPFVFEQVKLGSGASEAEARWARYKFLKKAQKSSGAEAIITAHHQDDVIETAILNMLRGTGRKGLTSLSTRPGFVRPLLKVTKKELIDYAQKQCLPWREDMTNQDETYLRNYIRHRLLPRFRQDDTVKLVSLVTSLRVTNQQLDKVLASQLQQHELKGKLDRSWFNRLPHAVAKEIMAAWLRQNRAGFDRKRLESLVVAGKTARPGQSFPVVKNLKLQVEKNNLALVSSER